MRPMRHVLFFLLMFIFTGCISTKTSFIYIKNIGKGDIDEVRIESKEGFYFSYGIITANSGAGYIGSYDYPYHDEYTVSWVDSKNMKHSKTIDLRPKIPKRFSGNIKLIFKIDSYNNIAADFKKR